MRWLLFLAAAIGLAGCARTRTTSKSVLDYPLRYAPAKSTAVATNKPGAIVTPSTVVAGKVMRVNLSARSVVVSFPLGQMPPLERRMNVYRAGLKVGEINLTGPRMDVFVAADIVAGECQVGDEVREN